MWRVDCTRISRHAINCRFRRMTTRWCPLLTELQTVELICSRHLNRFQIFIADLNGRIGYNNPTRRRKSGRSFQHEARRCDRPEHQQVIARGHRSECRRQIDRQHGIGTEDRVDEIGHLDGVISGLIQLYIGQHECRIGGIDDVGLVKVPLVLQRQVPEAATTKLAALPT